MELNVSSETPPEVRAAEARKAGKRSGGITKAWPLHLMLMPAVIVVFIFVYLPMGGLIMAFQDFKPALGFFKSPWVGMEQFRFMFEYPDSKQVIINTVFIAGFKILSNLIVPFVFALLLNEVRINFFKRTVQTLVYLPYFISWVVLGAILTDMLGTDGIVNQLLNNVFGIDPVFFLGDGNWFRATVIVSDVWQNFGFGTIVYLAALTGINPDMYEAAEVDGASRWKQTLHITIPCTLPVVVVVGTLAMGNILNGGFDQIFNLYTPLIYSKGDIIDTFVYRTGILNGQFSFGAAVGLFKSLVGMIMIIISYRLAYKLANYRIF